MSAHAEKERSALDAVHRLEEAEQKWRHVLIHVPQIGISLDPEGRITFANAYFLKLTGWTAEEILGKDWFTTCLPEEIREEVRKVFQRIMEGTHTFDFSTYENPIVTRSGERRLVAWSNVLTRDAEGRIVDVTCLGVDLTERIRLEAALREANERLELVLRCATDGYWDYDLVTGSRFVSPRFRRMAGLPEEGDPPSLEEWLGRIHADDRAVVEKAFNEGLAGGGDTFAVEFRLRRGTDEYIPVAVRAYVTRGEDGRAVRVTGSVSDVSDLKAAQAETARRLAQLEQWYRATLHRENRVIQLKKEVNELAQRLGMPPRYPAATDTEADQA